MARFNQTTSNPRKTTNHEGGEAYLLSPEMELYSQVCTASLQPKFYEQNTEAQIQRLQETISKVDPEFVCRLAVYAREKMYLRSVPLVLLVELFKSFDKNKQSGERNPALLRRATERVIQRADEITELMAYYKLAHGRKTSIDKNGKRSKTLNKMPRAMQKGIAEAFHKFDEYQFAKYNQDGDVKLRDALFLSHAKARDADEKALFNKIASSKLDVPYTWEVELSRLGQQKFESEEAKKQAFAAKWSELVTSGKLGYMALMRNLRNILEAGVSKETIKAVCKQLTEEKQVLHSKQLPFRYWSAFKELQLLQHGAVDPFALNSVMNALEVAVKTSVKNIAGFGDDTRVLIAADVSGSMQKPVSQKSKVELFDIGLLLGQLLQTRCENVVTGFFGDEWKVTDFTKDNVLENTANLRSREGEVGYSTNGHKVIGWLNDRSIEVDKVMIFTDCQLWDSEGGATRSSYYRNSGSIRKEWLKYRTKFPNAKLYLFDLGGYGTAPLDVMADQGVTLIAGWSDKIFEVMDSLEKGGSAIEFIKERVDL